MGTNPGALIVIDLKTEKTIVAVNPETAYSRAFRPGSVFKIVTAAVLLESGMVSPDEKIECKNFFKKESKSFTCSDPDGHGRVNLPKAIGCSCSVYFFKKSDKVSKNQICRIARGIGFNGKNATIKPPDNPEKYLNFLVGDDDGVAATPYQVACATAFIAKGKPLHKVNSFRLKPGTLSVIREGMHISSKAGTAKDVGKAGIDAACKTGTSTSTIRPGKYQGWFTAYFPCKNPEYVVTVFLEDGRGYTDAVPIGIKIIRAILLKQK